MEPETFVQFSQALQALSRRPLSQIELEVLKGVYRQQRYEEIAAELDLSTGYVKSVAAELWKVLSVFFGQPVKKGNIRVLLDQFWQNPSVYRDQPPITGVQHSIFRGEPIAQPPNFYDREEEQTLLQASIQRHSVTLLQGGLGVGKTALAAKVVEQLAQTAQFQQIIWRSLDGQKRFPRLVQEILEVDEAIADPVQALLDYCQSLTMLLVFDCAESILQGASLNGLNPYGADFQDYGLFLQRCCETLHESRVLVISQQKLSPLARSQAEGRNVGLMKLAELRREVCEQILQDRGIVASPHTADLIHNYQGNPLLLQQVIPLIQELYGGNVELFVRHTLYVGDLFEEVCLRAIQRLGSMEKTLLEIFSQSPMLTVIDLSQQAPQLPTSKVLELLPVLIDIGLIEQCEAAPSQMPQFRLRPLVQKVLSQQALTQPGVV
jgi:hypothetical protein